MAWELVHTSVPKGLASGTSGFCTVARSRDLPPTLVRTLESLSGYRRLPLDSLGVSTANPVAFSSVIVEIGGVPRVVVSRVADAGLDHTGRANKIAHHIVLSQNDLETTSPTSLFAAPRSFYERWEGEARYFETPRSLPPASAVPCRCATWKRRFDDPGWAGYIASSVFSARQVVVVLQPGDDVLSLFLEATELLPVANRWNATFSTYFTKAIPGVRCQWKAVYAGTPEAAANRALPNALVLDLTNGAALPNLDATPQTPTEREFIAKARAAALGAPNGETTPIRSNLFGRSEFASDSRGVSVPSPTFSNTYATDEVSLLAGSSTLQGQGRAQFAREAENKKSPTPSSRERKLLIALSVVSLVALFAVVALFSLFCNPTRRLDDRSPQQAQRTETPKPNPNNDNTSKQEDAASQNNESKQEDAASQNEEPKQENAASQNEEPKQEDAASQNEEPKQENAASQNNESKQEDAVSQNEEPKQEDAASQNNESKQEDAASQSNEPQQEDAASPPSVKPSQEDLNTNVKKAFKEFKDICDNCKSAETVVYAATIDGATAETSLPAFANKQLDDAFQKTFDAWVKSERDLDFGVEIELFSNGLQKGLMFEDNPGALREPRKFLFGQGGDEPNAIVCELYVSAYQQNGNSRNTKLREADESNLNFLFKIVVDADETSRLTRFEFNELDNKLQNDGRVNLPLLTSLGVRLRFFYDGEYAAWSTLFKPNVGPIRNYENINAEIQRLYGEYSLFVSEVKNRQNKERQYSTPYLEIESSDANWVVRGDNSWNFIAYKVIENNDEFETVVFETPQLAMLAADKKESKEHYERFQKFKDGDKNANVVFLDANAGFKKHKVAREKELYIPLFKSGTLFKFELKRPDGDWSSETCRKTLAQTLQWEEKRLDAFKIPERSPIDWKFYLSLPQEDNAETQRVLLSSGRLE